MATEISPELQALLLEQAETFARDLQNVMADLDALAFYRWVADRQYDDARRFANAARAERDKPRDRAAEMQLLTQVLNDNRNTCDCVHCAPHVRAVHGNGCSGYHCKGTCISSPLERCGRCNTPTRQAEISITGPYRTCPPCTDIIRN